jgi:hypothetical protein
MDEFELDFNLTVELGVWFMVSQKSSVDNSLAAITTTITLESEIMVRNVHRPTPVLVYVSATR